MVRLIHAYVDGGRWMPSGFPLSDQRAYDLVDQNTHRRGPSFYLRRRCIICPCGSVFLVQSFMPMVATMIVLVRVCVSMVATVTVPITMIVIVI